MTRRKTRIVVSACSGDDRQKVLGVPNRYIIVKRAFALGFFAAF